MPVGIIFTKYMINYTIKRIGKPWEAIISRNSKKAGDIRAGENYTYILTSNEGKKWRLSNRVFGEVRPFSMKSEMIAGSEGSKVDLIIRNHIFNYKGKFYILGGTPEGSSRADNLLGKRYIIRVEIFPFERLEDVDDLTLSRLIHHRGVVVGEMSGLGLNYHEVKIDEQLEEIGLVLAASSYLIYSTA
jgi:hypothetical protein